MAGLAKLDAVNLMLNNIGESPVSTLDGASGDAFVATAISILDETVRNVESEVWMWNRDFEYSLAPDISNNILVTDNMLSVDTDGSDADVNVAMRNGKLYNIDDQTFTFTAALSCEVVWEFPYDETPQYMRQYIAVRAARIFGRRVLGDATGQQLTIDDELEARTAARRQDKRNADRNIFKYGVGIGRMKQRRM